jgi:hypothetical protein
MLPLLADGLLEEPPPHEASIATASIGAAASAAHFPAIPMVRFIALVPSSDSPALAGNACAKTIGLRLDADNQAFHARPLIPSSER